jgi:AraC family mar-sox-rob regulon transcriptional activator
MNDSNSTQRRVVRVLLLSELERVTAGMVADRLHVSGSTLRRHLHAEGTCYQELLDAVRQHRCEKVLARRWLPGKSLAAELGFREPNSFYRAFQKWTGKSYTQYKRELHQKPLNPVPVVG